MASHGPTRTERGWVYVITNDAWPGYVKIGRAKDVDHRLRQYNTYSPHRDFKVVLALPFSDVRKAEQDLINHLIGFSIPESPSREWFRAHPADVSNILLKVYRRNMT